MSDAAPWTVARAFFVFALAAASNPRCCAVAAGRRRECACVIMGKMSPPARAISALFTCSLFLAGCHYSGNGSGLLRAPDPHTPGGLTVRGPVSFTWQARGDATRGTIEAKLPDGRDFSGSYAQPVSSEWRDDYNLYWGAWTGPWGHARPWYNGPRSGFVTHYSNKALAHLATASGERMRCEFELFDANAGLTGGGQGECQLSTNEDVFGAVLKRDE